MRKLYPARYKAYDAAKYRRDPEKKKARERLRDRTEAKARFRRRYAESPAIREKAQNQKREQRAKNPEHYRAKAVEYRNIRRARIKGAPVVEMITRGQLNELTRKQANLCFYCHDEMAIATIDHIQPLSRGGSHVMANIAMACADCNRRKRDMDPFDFLRKIGVA